MTLKEVLAGETKLPKIKVKVIKKIGESAIVGEDPYDEINLDEIDDYLDSWKPNHLKNLTTLPFLKENSQPEDSNKVEDTNDEINLDEVDDYLDSCKPNHFKKLTTLPFLKENSQLKARNKIEDTNDEARNKIEDTNDEINLDEVDDYLDSCKPNHFKN